jgi:hypothetical protein
MGENVVTAIDERTALQRIAEYLLQDGGYTKPVMAVRHSRVIALTDMGNQALDYALFMQKLILDSYMEIARLTGIASARYVNVVRSRGGLVDPDVVDRFCAALVEAGYMTETDNGFALTPAGEAAVLAKLPESDPNASMRGHRHSRHSPDEGTGFPVNRNSRCLPLAGSREGDQGSRHQVGASSGKGTALVLARCPHPNPENPKNPNPKNPPENLNPKNPPKLTLIPGENTPDPTEATLCCPSCRDYFTVILEGV